MSTHNLEILARIAIGIEAVDDGIGAVIVAANPDGSVRLFVEGGALPSGKPEKTFRGRTAATDAMWEALTIARALVEEEVSNAEDFEASQRERLAYGSARTERFWHQQW